MLSSIHFSGAAKAKPIAATDKQPSSAVANRRLPDTISTFIPMDSDKSAITWKTFNKESDEELTQKNAAVINNDSTSAMAIITGRGLLMSKDLLGHLGGYTQKILAWVTNNGQNIFLRPSTNGVLAPFKEWFTNLSFNKEDKAWKAHIKEKTGWQHEKICQLIETVVKKNGFNVVDSVPNYNRYSDGSTLFVKHHRKGSKNVVVEFMPDETAFVIRPQHHGDAVTMHKAFNDGVKISGEITRTMRAQGIGYDMIVKDHPKVFMHYIYMPEGIQKDAAVSWLLAKDARLKKVDRVIPVGDSDNDETMLVKDAFYLSDYGDGRVVSSFPILSGQRKEQFKRMKGVNPQSIMTEQRGELAEALTEQLKKPLNQTTVAM